MSRPGWLHGVLYALVVGGAWCLFGQMGAGVAALLLAALIFAQLLREAGK